MMFAQRKMLSMLFLLFIILLSLMFSGLFSNLVEGMTTDEDTDKMSEEEMFQKLSGGNDQITLDDFKTLLEQHPELKTLLKTKFTETDDITSPPAPEVTTPAPNDIQTPPVDVNQPDPTDIQTTDEDTTTDGDAPNTESFVTRLHPSDFTQVASKLTPLSKTTPVKPNNNQVFTRVFEFSNPQQFDLKGP